MDQYPTMTAEDKLYELVRQARCAGHVVKLGVVSQRDFAEMWHAKRSAGLTMRSSRTPNSTPTKMLYWFYNDQAPLIVTASSWCPDGEAGVG